MSADRASAAPELLAPAGDFDCVLAAIENGADAVYFGLDSGFNARARARNFSAAELPELMRLLHRRGLKGYVTFNTLVFPGELHRAAEAIERIADGGVDAVLVQDFGVARLAREICPGLEVHASTQMTLTSGECIEAARSLGLARVVLPRELSIDEIRKVRAATDMPVEVFVHGALCVAYSGQCLTSESLGGRSANRGQCAQACRLPYDLQVDGEDRDLGPVRYLLSPQDLAAYELIPQLIDAGVCSLKIEGRLKTPEYVANITQHYRRAIDQAMAGRPVRRTAEETREMELSFSRGFSPGWLQGCDHKMLVPGDNSAKRGARLGEVIRSRGNRITARLSSPLSLGDGVAFAGDRADGADCGGRIYELRSRGQRLESTIGNGETVELVVRGKGFDADKIHPGQRIWKSDDPRLNRRLRETFAGRDPRRRTRIDLHITARVGAPLRVTASTPHGIGVTVQSDQPLETARRHPASEETLRAQFDRLGGTPFRLRECQLEIAGGPMVPHSVTGQLRHRLVDALTAAYETPPTRNINRDTLPRLLRQAAQSTTAQPSDADGAAPSPAPQLWALCRTPEQLTAAAEAGVDGVYVEYHHIANYPDAVATARSLGLPIYLATLRIQKPGEIGLTRKLLRHGADGILARNLAALELCRTAELPAIADFSLNMANPLSADWLRQQGARRTTISYDLNRDQLSDLIAAMPGRDLEAVVHQHMPMFHMEHCVFCAVISPGTNKTNCGRPCDRHAVKLRDRIGMEHPLHADIGCRNTLYNATPQSGAEVVRELLLAGVRHYRVELLEDSPGQTRRIIDLYRKLLAGRIEPAEVWQQLSASNRVGVTRGTLEQRRNPLAII